MNANSEQQLLHIKKYPNRRYYDATRSCHVTLDELLNLVRSGRDVRITDSRSGDDITNQILLQIMLDRDNLKLDLFPSTMLHWILRSERQVLRNTMEPFLNPLFGMMATSQKQFDSYVRQVTGGGSIPTPFDWFNQMSQTLRPQESAEESPPTENDEPAPPPQENETINDLREKIGDLSRRIEELGDREAENAG